MLPVFRKHSTVPNSFISDFFNDDFWPTFSGSVFKNESTPAVNVTENKKEFTIDVAAPGLDKNDFHVTVDHNTLTISSEKEVNNESENEGILRREFSYNSFSRSFTLPENTDTTKIKASHKNGILSISVPKAKVEEHKALEVKIN